MNGAESVLGRLLAVIDLVATLATSIIPLVEELFGGVPSFLSGATTVLMAIGSLAQGAFAVLNTADWWKKVGANVMALAAIDGASTPVALLQTGLSLLLTPVLGNFLDMAGHGLLAKGFADYADYTRQANMSIQDWCAQDSGCPAEL